MSAFQLNSFQRDAFQEGGFVVQIVASDSCTVQASDTWRELQRTYVDLSAVDQTQWHVFDDWPIHLNPPFSYTAFQQDAFQWDSFQIGGFIAGAGVLATYNVTDSCAIVASEALALTSAVVASDTCVIQASDSQPLIVTTNQTLTDTCAVVIGSELPAILVTLTVTDSCAIQASEGTPTIVAVLTASDSAAVQASEGAIGISSTVSASGDSTTVQASEAILINSTVSMADSAGITGNDLVSILATGTVTDSLTLSLVEGSVSILAVISCADTCAVICSEATPNVIQNSLIGAVDSDAIQASDATPLIASTLSVADTCVIQASDVNIGPHLTTAQDDLAVQITEVVTNSLPTAASDSLILGAQDLIPLIFVPLSVIDSCAIQLSEVAAQQVSGAATPITASDSCALPIIDEIEPFLAIAVTDSCALPIDERIGALAIPAEQVALMLLESVLVEKTWLEVIWGGGMRVEEAGRYLYAGSYRMGPRNADETRGSEY